ncbi:MAG: hypothetical protein ABFC67_00150 [Mizugakiibacter sp.]|uniref:hypothetical protein n=1 Tax=Mizugakiibacter sp. TaxID=1972610 RepID=UPI0031CAAD22|nr:hypothetical protein [Xanthomonadaceae bacterium]
MLLDIAAALAVLPIGLLALAKFDAWCELRHGRRYFSMTLFAPTLGAAVLLGLGLGALDAQRLPPTIDFALLAIGAATGLAAVGVRLRRPHRRAGFAGELIEIGVFALLANLSLPLLALTAVLYVGAMLGLGRGAALPR